MTQTVYTPQRPLDLVLLSPKGPLYRKRGGIFKRSLRYQPLTLTTLSALVPKSLPVNIRLIDESIEELPEDFTADLVAMTVITGNAPRAYELAAQMRAKNIPVVLGGPHVTLLPQEALQHADTVCTGKRKVIFVDLNLVSDIGYAKRLFTALIPLNIQWFGLSTVLIAHNHELMDLMARSGCKGLLLGLETVSDGSLKDAGKQFNGSVDYKELIGDVHRLGIAIQGCFVFGLDHDTTDVFDHTVDLAIDAGIDLPRFSVLTPFPGTPLFKRLEEEQRILTTDWSLYDAQHVVFRPALMSAHELELGHERAWKKVYRYRSIAKRLWQARNFKPLALTANLGYRFYAHHLHQYYTCDWPVEHCPAKSGNH